MFHLELNLQRSLKDGLSSPPFDRLLRPGRYGKVQKNKLTAESRVLPVCCKLTGIPFALQKKQVAAAALARFHLSSIPARFGR